MIWNNSASDGSIRVSALLIIWLVMPCGEDTDRRGSKPATETGKPFQSKGMPGDFERLKYDWPGRNSTLRFNHASSFAA